jgi:uncharacterized protein (TIGR03437 family)
VDPSDRVLVADTSNSRVQVYGKASTIVNYATPAISLTGLSVPLSIAMTSQGSFWIAAAGAGRMVHFPSIDQLPLRNNQFDGTLPVNTPRTAVADPYGNLLAGDGFNRLLYFVPQVDIVNAANYSARALSPGTIAAMYPHPQSTGTGSNTTTTTSVLSGGTASPPAGVLPFPTTLADTQVIVNGKPTPLYYVSPGQINLILSNTLPSGGTADVQVVKASTGQIYGGAELGLSTASPALFTATATGSGQISAINADDGTINSPQNPVKKGSYISLYGTGVGFVANAPPDGYAATGALPAPELPQILIGSTGGGTAQYIPVENIQYSGLAPSSVGEWQINVLIPASAPSGPQVQLSVLQYSISSLDLSVPGATVTTIAVK